MGWPRAALPKLSRGAYANGVLAPVLGPKELCRREAVPEALDVLFRILFESGFESAKRTFQAV
jgi:hypothetical protein